LPLLAARTDWRHAARAAGKHREIIGLVTTAHHDKPLQAFTPAAQPLGLHPDLTEPKNSLLAILSSIHRVLCYQI
jgi:hypothetical protein